MPRCFVAIAFLLVFSASAMAQPAPVTATTRTPVSGWTCIPHPYTGLANDGYVFCVAPVSAPLVQTTPSFDVPSVVVDFPQVFLGVPGLEQTYVSVKNKSDAQNIVLVEVTIGGRSPVTTSLVLPPHGRQTTKVNDWPEFAGVQNAAMSIVVRTQYDATPGVAMHPADARTFWSGAKILEGRSGKAW